MIDLVVMKKFGHATFVLKCFI